MTTPHIDAAPGEFAETVLMPGDPLRAKYIADTYFSDVKQVNTVRNMLAFSGYYRGQPVSVMGSGMGIPSISIYAHELYKHYAVKNIIRVGSCGSLQPNVKLRDVVLALGAATDSNVNKIRLKGNEFAATASFNLLEAAVLAARELSLDFHVGNVFSTDLFYGLQTEGQDLLSNYSVLATEMEAAGLYGVAAECQTQALAINTVSDHLITKQSLSSEERQTSFDNMINIALNSLTHIR